MATGGEVFITPQRRIEYRQEAAESGNTPFVKVLQVFVREYPVVFIKHFRCDVEARISLAAAKSRRWALGPGEMTTETKTLASMTTRII